MVRFAIYDDATGEVVSYGTAPSQRVADMQSSEHGTGKSIFYGSAKPGVHKIIGGVLILAVTGLPV